MISVKIYLTERNKNFSLLWRNYDTVTKLEDLMVLIFSGWSDPTKTQCESGSSGGFECTTGSRFLPNKLFCENLSCCKYSHSKTRYRIRRLSLFFGEKTGRFENFCKIRFLDPGAGGTLYADPCGSSGTKPTPLITRYLRYWDPECQSNPKIRPLPSNLTVPLVVWYRFTPGLALKKPAQKNPPKKTQNKNA